MRAVLNHYAPSSITERADSVFDLVDRLSVDLLRDVWRAREPLPELRLSAITTSSGEGTPNPG